VHFVIRYKAQPFGNWQCWSAVPTYGSQQQKCLMIKAGNKSSQCKIKIDWETFSSVFHATRQLERQYFCITSPESQKNAETLLPNRRSGETFPSRRPHFS